MTRAARRMGATALALAVLGLVLPVAAGARLSPASAAVPSFESQLLSLTNADRAKARLTPLASSSTLVSIARTWSTHMAATGTLGHNPSLASQVSGWSSLGENAAGRVSSAAQAESLFMGSSGHRANILQPKYNRVGIGVARAADGTYWVTVDFEQSAGYTPKAAAPVKHTSSTSTVRTTRRSSASASSAAARAAAAARAGRSATRVPLVRPAGPALDAALVARAAHLAGQDSARLAGLSGAVVPVGLTRLPATPDSPAAPFQFVLAELVLAIAAVTGLVFLGRSRYPVATPSLPSR